MLAPSSGEKSASRTIEQASRRGVDATIHHERAVLPHRRQQCVIETSRRGTSDGGEATFAWSLFEWYERRCLLQEKVVNFCFQTGTLAIIGCLMTYMKGHLTLGDPEDQLVAHTAFVAFALNRSTNLSSLAISACCDSYAACACSIRKARACRQAV